MKEITQNKNKTTKCSCAKIAKYNQKGANILGFLIPAIAETVFSLFRK